MIVGVVGSRGLDCYDEICKQLPRGTSEIISGGATGVDALARRYALENRLRIREFLPDYKKYGRRATLVRNLEIIRACDVVYVFWDNSSNGCKHVINSCLKENIPVKVITP